MSIGNKLKYLIAENQMTAKELSEKANIPNSTLADIINNRTKNLSIQKANVLCKILNCSLDYLIDDNVNDRNFPSKNDIGISNSEVKYLKKYRTLDKYGKLAIDKLMDIELQRIKNSKEDK